MGGSDEKNIPLYWCVSIGLLLLLVSCGVFSKGPEDVYKEFWNACNSGDIATAYSLLTDIAKEETGDTDNTCLNTHDFFQRIQNEMGIESNELEYVSPVVVVTGNTAYLTWVEDGTDITIQMYNENDGWKVHRFYFGRPSND